MVYKYLHLCPGCIWGLNDILDVYSAFDLLQPIVFSDGSLGFLALLRSSLELLRVLDNFLYH